MNGKTHCSMQMTENQANKLKVKNGLYSSLYIINFVF